MPNYQDNANNLEIMKNEHDTDSERSWYYIFFLYIHRCIIYSWTHLTRGFLGSTDQVLAMRLILPDVPQPRIVAVDKYVTWPVEVEYGRWRTTHET